jgi:hypothetical protein
MYEEMKPLVTSYDGNGMRTHEMDGAAFAALEQQA